MSFREDFGAGVRQDGLEDLPSSGASSKGGFPGGAPAATRGDVNPPGTTSAISGSTARPEKQFSNVLGRFANNFEKLSRKTYDLLPDLDTIGAAPSPSADGSSRTTQSTRGSAGTTPSEFSSGSFNDPSGRGSGTRGARDPVGVAGASSTRGGQGAARFGRSLLDEQEVVQPEVEQNLSDGTEADRGSLLDSHRRQAGGKGPSSWGSSSSSSRRPATGGSAGADIELGGDDVLGDGTSVAGGDGTSGVGDLLDLPSWQGLASYVGKEVRDFTGKAREKTEEIANGTKQYL